MAISAKSATIEASALFDAGPRDAIERSVGKHFGLRCDARVAQPQPLHYRYDRVARFMMRDAGALAGQEYNFGLHHSARVDPVVHRQSRAGATCAAHT